MFFLSPFTVALYVRKGLDIFYMTWCCYACYMSFQILVFDQEMSRGRYLLSLAVFTTHRTGTKRTKRISISFFLVAVIDAEFIADRSASASH